MVLRLIPRSPRRRIRLVTVIGGLGRIESPVGLVSLRQLDTSNGCQDHTALPSAATSLVSAPLIAHRPFDPPCDHVARLGAAASTASHPASVTIAIRPCVGWDVGSSRSDLGQAGTEIFLQMGLDTGQITRLSRSNKSHRLTHKSRAFETTPPSPMPHACSNISWLAFQPEYAARKIA